MDESGWAEETRRAARTYTSAADRFTAPQLGFWDRCGSAAVDRLRLTPGAQVLDLCCGAGASAVTAAHAVGPAGRVVGVDVTRPLPDSRPWYVTRTMTPTDRERITAILSARDDDGPRLEWAKYLRSQGDPRGEFIDVQCALAGAGADDRRRDALEAREGELLGTHAAAWLAAAGLARGEAAFRRGFIEQIRISWRRWWQCGERALEAEPVVSVKLLGPRGRDLPRLVGGGKLRPGACARPVEQ